MRYLKLFEEINTLIFYLTHQEYDELFMTPNFYCFSNKEILMLSEFLKKEIKEKSIKFDFVDARINSSSSNKFFLYDDMDMGFAIRDDIAMVYKSDGSSEQIIAVDSDNYPEDATTPPNEIIILKNFTLLLTVNGDNYSKRHVGGTHVYINKVKDEWFLVSQQNYVTTIHYKCDQIDGLVAYLKNFLDNV